MSKQDEKIDPTLAKSVTEYVHENYKSYKGKELYIKELDTCLHITRDLDRDASPLILSKKNI